MKELESFIEMLATMKINYIEYTLTKVEDLSGELAIWVLDSYTVYATPYYEGVPVPVQVIDCNGQEIGIDSYPIEVESFERYCKVVQTLGSKIIRRSRM